MIYELKIVFREAVVDYLKVLYVLRYATQYMTCLGIGIEIGYLSNKSPNCYVHVALTCMRNLKYSKSTQIVELRIKSNAAALPFHMNSIPGLISGI